MIDGLEGVDGPEGWYRWTGWVYMCWRDAIDGLERDVGCSGWIGEGQWLILKERCPSRQKSRVEYFKAKVEPLLTEMTVENDAMNGPELMLGVRV